MGHKAQIAARIAAKKAIMADELNEKNPDYDMYAHKVRVLQDIKKRRKLSAKEQSRLDFYKSKILFNVTCMTDNSESTFGNRLEMPQYRSNHRVTLTEGLAAVVGIH